MNAKGPSRRLDDQIDQTTRISLSAIRLIRLSALGAPELVLRNELAFLGKLVEEFIAIGEGRPAEDPDPRRWEVASVTIEDGDTSYEHVGDYPTRAVAIANIRKQPPGDYGLCRADEGHYREFIRHDDRGHLAVSDTGEEGTFTPLD